ncbi:MAG: cupin domain-containing protein [Steroidobacteraceae bacterium]
MINATKPVHAADLPWMPLGEGVWARPLRFDGNERSLQLKVAPGVTIDRHRHAGEVHALNLSGSRRLETGEIVRPGGYVYEPPGNEDSWRCVGEEPCIVYIVMSGRLTYVGENGEAFDYMDTPKLRALYLEWCRENDHEPNAIGALD